MATYLSDTSLCAYCVIYHFEGLGWTKKTKLLSKYSLHQQSFFCLNFMHLLMVQIIILHINIIHNNLKHVHT